MNEPTKRDKEKAMVITAMIVWSLVMMALANGGLNGH